MKGLYRSNLYAALANTKVFSMAMLLLGAFTVAFSKKSPYLLLAYVQLSIVGFSLNAMASLRMENAAKWVKYKLTMPVKRAQIIKSHFVILLLLMSLGMAFAGIAVVLSCFLHGFVLDKSTDIISMFVMGISISLFTCAVFFPLFHYGGADRTEVLLIISLLCGVAIFIGCTALINALLSDPTLLQLILAEIVLLAVALSVSLLSFPLTVSIFKKREY